MPTFQIRGDFGPCGDVGLRLAEGPSVEAVLAAFRDEKFSGLPPGGRDELRVPDELVRQNGSSYYVSRGVRYYAVRVG
jgi:hypothetical protein